jgi:4-methylaminobutanoate oxidase (formaldehyde-forming)
VLQAVTSADVGAAALPFRAAREIGVRSAPVLAQRITYVGELGYELYVAPEWAVQVWDALLAAGAEHGIEPGGYRVLESLRMEKGYRYMGTDISAGDTPYQAGLGFCVALDKGDFVGREALARAAEGPPGRALRTLVVGGEDYLALYGGEAVRLDGQTVGRVRSCAYGYTVRRNIAYAYLPAGTEAGAHVEVEVLGEPVAAAVAADVLYDPRHERVRG